MRSTSMLVVRCRCRAASATEARNLPLGFRLVRLGLDCGPKKKPGNRTERRMERGKRNTELMEL